MVDTESGTGQVVVTICNYSKYQGQRDTSGTRAGHERDTSGTNENKGNKDNKDNTSSGDDGFDDFWQVVARKVGKGQARTAYRAALKKTDRETIRRGMEEYALSVKGKDPTYIAHPATWLNGERWADEGVKDGRSYREKPKSEWTAKDREQAAMQWL